MLNIDLSGGVDQVTLFFPFQDHFHRESSEMPDEASRLNHAVRLLEIARRTISGPGLDMTKLQAIASCKYGLVVAARWLVEHYSQKVEHHVPPGILRHLLEVTKDICSNRGLEWPG